MKSSPHLLIITPTLGESEFLLQTLKSIEVLTFKVTHVISCPKSKVEELQKRFTNSIVVPDAGKTGGIYGALNAALDQTKNDWEWFTYINDDDLLGVDFEKAFTTHCKRANPEAVFYGNVRLIDNANLTLGFITTAPSPGFIPAMLQQRMSPLNQQGMVFSRKCVEFLKGFDLQYSLCADLDFWARAYSGKFPFRYVPLEVGQFRIRPGQLSGNIELTRRELDDITQKLFPKSVSTLMRLATLLAYRLYNLPRYITRFRKVGIKTSESVLAS